MDLDLDPSYKDGSRSLGMFRKGKTCNTAKFHGTDFVICSHSREWETPSHSQRNMVVQWNPVLWLLEKALVL